MRKSVFFLTILLLNSFSATAQTTISGDISGQIFKPSGNPWVVKENIYIESGEKTIIKPGCIFLFKPFTGIVVQGSFEVEGQSDAPVVFTSINDTAYNDASTLNAEPFDWNGISIEKTAGKINMSNFVLSFAVYGLKSKKDAVVVERGIFHQNGQFNFTIGDKILDVENNVPFSYSINGKMAELQKMSANGWAKPVGAGFIITGSAFLGVMGYFVYNGNDFNKKYYNADNTTDMYDYAMKRDKFNRNALVTGIIGGILVPTGTGLLLWQHKNSTNEKISALNSFTLTPNGFQIVMKF